MPEIIDAPKQPAAPRVLWTPQPHTLWERDWFGPFVLVGFFTFIILGIVHKIFPIDLVGVIVGYMAGWVGSIISFKYGTTSGERAKDSTIRELSGGLPKQ